MGTILTGTCGYSYREWAGPFYPDGTKPEDYLRYYSGFFSTLELDYTYYSMPTARQLEGMLVSGGPELTFSVKATDTLTHKVDPRAWQDQAKTYIDALGPMREAGRLEAVLFQFPYSFHYEPENRKYLDSLLGEFSGIPCAVEFRNADWSNNRVIEGLKERGAAYVSTDLPELKGLPPVLDISTSSLAYFRLHGRNAGAWWGSDSRARYDYLYSDEELKYAADRVQRLAAKASRVLVYFNNHARAQAVRNALMLKKLLALGNGSRE
ncbi:MAG: DUF72 domain-containing protein [Treponema sp.]|nr:DUF72 domain-containing protein [Treponema sp.]